MRTREEDSGENQIIKCLFIAFVLGLGLTVALLWLLSAPSTEPPVARAASLHVCPSGCTYSSIQAAAVAASDGDVIKVATGTYTDVHARARADIVVTGVITQVVYISKSVTVRGGYTTAFTDPPDPVANPSTLDAQGQGRVLYIIGGISPTIEGLRITNGNAVGLVGDPSDEDAGGGIYVITATININNNQIFSNTAVAGGGLYFLNSTDVTLTGNTITNNTGLNRAGGLLLRATFIEHGLAGLNEQGVGIEQGAGWLPGRRAWGRGIH